MANTTSSPSMLLPIPAIGVDPGPQYAQDINNCLTIIDGHNHSAGYGVQINPAGLNINADLPINNNNLTGARSVRFQSQPSAIALPTDLGSLYELGVDLYYVDGSGNNVRITQSGGVAGSPGSISNLTSPASAAYVSGTQTFVWQSAANTPANLDAGFIILRNNTANSKGLTLSPPAAMGTDYSITLPPVPASVKLLSIDAAGNVGATLYPDGTSIDISSNNIQVKDGGITPPKLAAYNFQKSSSSGTANITNGTPQMFANMTVDITTTANRPIEIKMQAATGSSIGVNTAGFQFDPAGQSGRTGRVAIYRDGVFLIDYFMGNSNSLTLVPSSVVSFTDTPGAAGTYNYQLWGYIEGGSGSLICFNSVITAREL